jgi:hypothetical protein
MGMVKRIAEISLYVVMFLAAYAAMNYYVYNNVAQVITPLGKSPLGQVVFVLLAVSYPLSQFFKSRLRRPLIVSFVGSLWLGMLATAVTVFLLYDFLSLFLPMGNQSWAIALIIALTVLGASKAWRGPVVKEVSLQQKKGAAAFSIAHLSDLHLGPQTSLKWLEKVIAQVNSLEVDIVVITGDVIEDTYEGMARFLPAFQNLRGKGVYAVSGNHEYYQGIEHFQQFCRDAGIIIADGQCLKVADGVNLLGLGGRITGIDPKTEALIREQLGGSEDYNILLLHQPVGFKKTAALGIDLQLSGHTHRGQILPLNFLIHLVYPYAYGLHALGESHIYVSSGTGTWGPPLRIGSSSEIVKIKVS